jgi:hypothetical protein
MKAFFIGGRIDSNSLDAHFFTCTDNPKSNLTPVGYQYFIKHKIKSIDELKVSSVTVIEKAYSTKNNT